MIKEFDLRICCAFELTLAYAVHSNLKGSFIIALVTTTCFTHKLMFFFKERHTLEYYLRTVHRENRRHSISLLS